MSYGDNIPEKEKDWFKSDNTILPVKAITPSLMIDYLKSEHEKHQDCKPGRCRHTKEGASVAHVLATAFESCPEMQERIDRQIQLAFEYGQRDGDLANALRTFAVAMIEQGWALARFSIEGGGHTNGQVM